MKLWQSKKDAQITKLNGLVENFTAENDISYDQVLINYDIIGSIAHASMLKKIGILKNGELAALKKPLKEIVKLNKKGKFRLDPEDEDVHSKVENYLTKKIGEVGKKLHTGRSRNDQILVDLRLYTRERLLTIEQAILDLCVSLIKFAKNNLETPMPGYTHFRKAMPSSVALWACSLAESLLDDLEIVKNAYKLNNQNPLGSAAGYGVPLNIDREYTTSLLGFGKTQNNVLYVQNSRGKIESIVLGALTQIMTDLSRFSNELIIFSMDEFGFINISQEFCTGSSIMPKKRNPDVLELIRARSSKVLSYYLSTITTIKDLLSGYSRDLQETKEYLIKSLDITEECLKILAPLVKKLEVNKDRLIDAFTPELFAADEAINLAKYGIPFREAYKQINYNFHDLKTKDPVKSIQLRKHLGAPGNLNIEKLEKQIEEENLRINQETKAIDKKIQILFK